MKRTKILIKNPAPCRSIGETEYEFLCVELAKSQLAAKIPVLDDKRILMIGSCML